MIANYENVKTLMHLERGAKLVSSSGEFLKFVHFDDVLVFCIDSNGIYRSFRLEDVEFTQSVVQCLAEVCLSLERPIGTCKNMTAPGVTIT